MQADLARTRSATSGADGSGQGRAETNVSQEFAEDLINDCVKYAWEQMQVVKAEAEEKHNKFEERIFDTQTANK